MPRARAPIGQLQKVTYTRNPEGTWTARALVNLANGKKPRPSGTGATKEEAVKILERRAAALVRDQGTRTRKDDPTINEIIDEFLANDFKKMRKDKKWEESTLSNYLQHIKHIRDGAGAMRVSDATTIRLEEALFGDTMPSPSQASQRRLMLIWIFRYAVRAEIVAANPAREIIITPHDSTVVDEHGQPIVIPPEKMRALLNRAREYDCEGRSQYGPKRTFKAYPFLALMLGAGLRHAEIRGLRWRDLDPEARTISIRETVTYPSNGKRVEKPRPKTDAGVRMNYIPGWVRDALVHYMLEGDLRTRNPNDRIFTARNGTALRGTSVYTSLRKMLAGTEFEDSKRLLQIFRHTAATAVGNRNAKNAAVGEITYDKDAAEAFLGHKVIKGALAHYLSTNILRPDWSYAFDEFNPDWKDDESTTQSDPTPNTVSWT